MFSESLSDSCTSSRLAKDSARTCFCAIQSLGQSKLQPYYNGALHDHYAPQPFKISLVSAMSYGMHASAIVWLKCNSEI
eukprot:2797600-Amphidinium_carterae.2